MKRIFNIIALFLCSSLSPVLAQISDADRDQLTSHLKTSQDQLLDAVKGLSADQWLYKPNAESWSIAETVEHLAKSEQNISGMAQMSLQQSPAPEIKEQLNFTDDMVLELITSREQKVKTRPEFEPTQEFSDYKGSLKAFKERRKQNTQYAQGTNDDLRAHYAEFPFGWIDSYQVILFMSGHTQRHIDQIEEVKAAKGYPL